MKRTVVASMIGLALCAGCVLSTAQAATAKRPNLVIILADDLGMAISPPTGTASLKHLT